MRAFLCAERACARVLRQVQDELEWKLRVLPKPGPSSASHATGNAVNPATATSATPTQPSDSDHAGPEVLEIFLGDGHEFGGRSDNIPRFHAPYRRLGNAVWTAY